MFKLPSQDKTPTEQSEGNNDIQKPADNPVEKPEEKPEENSKDPIKDQISKMTLDEKIGQMLILGVEGYAINANSKSLVEKYKAGGFIILGENVQNTNQLLNLVNSLKKENTKNKIPLFLSIDEEGGRITRVPKEFKKLPTNKEIGQKNNKALSNKIGGILAEEIRAFGFNMDFAPVLDINSNPKNPVIGDRSFGATPEVVSTLGLETMNGIKAGNVIPVVKHFPGHGDTSTDSHVGLPTVNNDLKRLESFEFKPFSQAIKSQVDAVMIAHILLPKIDNKNPSSMSKTIITDILRKKLNFNGVVVTDDMTMGAIMKNYNIGEAAVKSVNAGTDIVLVCHGYDREIEVINALKKAVEDGKISKDRIDESVYRILKLKKNYNLKDELVSSVNVNKINTKIDTILKNYFTK
jgi:beta-N-acetylhexosaminidase